MVAVLFRNCVGGRTCMPLRLEGVGPGERGEVHLVFVVFGYWKHRFTLAFIWMLCSFIMFLVFDTYIVR